MMAPTNLDELAAAEYSGVLPAPLSLLSVRRPSLAGLPPVASRIPSIIARPNEELLNLTTSRYSHTEEEDSNVANLNQGLEIKMQGWVGEGVGKMSISPSGRDVVLATRSGLYIIDLEMPLEVPRFIPQGGTWDVADVQWNPHPSRGNLVVSTSSEKLLIWNLDRADRSAIQHILSKHYRSITDVNWHNHHPDVVTSTGIDSWIWIWDLRTAVKPVAGLCAFNPGATQVKWNRHNENILASSHGSMLLIWDQRKGAVPLAMVKAHSSRIYGVDWSRTNGNEIVTCSLDRTIKFWDAGLGWYSPSNTDVSENPSYITHSTPTPSSYTPSTMQPTSVIHLHYPVWRSRYVPFGNGVLSLPQRGFQRPELLRCVTEEFDQAGYEPIYPIPEGAAGEGIVKEYVWRVKGGLNSSFDDREFQLVTWNEDRTIRAWPINSNILEHAGLIHGGPIRDDSHRPSTKYISYRNLANSSLGRPHDQNVSTSSGIYSGARSSVANADFKTALSTSPPRTFKKLGEGTATIKRGGTMTKGPSRFKNKDSFGMHALTWMPSVKTVGRGRSTRSGTWDVELPRESLESSVTSLDSFKFGYGYAGDERKENTGFSVHDASQPRIVDDREFGAESQATLTWAEELTSVINGLRASKTGKISLEKVRLEKRMCILGLQGPWGESSSVFVRVTFVFPKDYPRSTLPPKIDLERNHLIPVKRRAMLLRELRSLGRNPPCLESCLRLLLGLPIEKEGVLRKVVEIDSGSSSDESVQPMSPRGKVPTPGQGLAEFRTSQGIFSPNGQLVIFSHVLIRMVRNPSRNISLSPSTSSRIHAQRGGSGQETHQTSGGLSDALRRLTAVAQDRKIMRVTVGMDEDLLRTLETLSYSKLHSASGVTTTSATRDSGYIVRPMRKSRVSIRDLADVTGLDQFVARSYVVSGANARHFCLENANIAKSLNRTDHERVFGILASLLEITSTPNGLASNRTNGWRYDYLSQSVILSFLYESTEKKDVLMLAMISIALLIADRDCRALSFPSKPDAARHLTRISVFPDNLDSVKSSERFRARASSTASSIAAQQSIGRHSSFSSLSGLPSTLASHNSSRSAWMGLANGVRYLVGSQDGQSTPKAQGSPIERSRTLPIVQESNSALSRSFDNGHSSSGDNVQKHSPRFMVSFSSPGYHEKEFGGNTIAGSSTRGKRLVARMSLTEARTSAIADNEWQLSIYVLAFAEILYRWGLKNKRVELLRCLPRQAASFTGSIDMDMESERLFIHNVCSLCNAVGNSSPDSRCFYCARRQQKMICTVCRLPVDGLSHVCLVCCHVTHMSCWGFTKQSECPLGCGCECRGGFEVGSETDGSQLLHTPSYT